MKSVFTKTWESDAGNKFRSELMAERFGNYSALRFVREEHSIEMGKFTDGSQFLDVFGHLMPLRAQLAPTLTAEIVKLEPKKRSGAIKPVAPDVEFQSQAA